MINKLKSRILKLDEHTLEVVKKSSGSMIVKVLSMLLGFVVSIVLGRNLGASGLGVVSVANQIVSVVFVLSMFGMNNVVVKEISIAYERKDFQKIANTIYTSFLINIPVVIILSILFILLTPFFSISVFKEPELKIPLMIGLLAMIPQVLSRIFGAALNGYRKIWQSNLVDDSLCIGIVTLGLFLLLSLGSEITITKVSLLYAFGRVVVFIAASWYWKMIFKFKGNKAPQIKPMLKVAMPLLVVSLTTLIATNTDVLMLGILSNTKEVGIYSVAAKLGLMTSFFHIISISTLIPKIASLYAEDRKFELETMIQQVTKVLGIIGVISFIMYVFFGNYFLLLWGEEFSSAYGVLIIIAFGQFFNLGTGATGIILMMTGHEKTVGKITFISALINIALNYLLIPIFGALGAAIATATTLIIENIVKLIVVKNVTGISTIPFLLKSKKTL